MTGYSTVRIPKELVDQIDAFLKKQSLGYTSRAEVVKDAVRSFLEKKGYISEGVKDKDERKR
jgi:metal-responsive CopG/Arc/MetJ family transcriptional regulator